MPSGGGRLPSAPRAPAAPRGPDPAVQAAKAEAAILRQARAEAALAAAQNNAARAQQIYQAALARLTPGTLQATQAQIGLERAMNAVARSSKEAGGGAAVLPRTIAGLSHEAAAAAKGLLGVGAAVGALKGGYDLAVM